MSFIIDSVFLISFFVIAIDQIIKTNTKRFVDLFHCANCKILIFDHLIQTQPRYHHPQHYERTIITHLLFRMVIAN